MPLVDLSQPIESGMPVYPGSPPVAVTQRESLADAGSRVTDLDIETHVGTHVDAPSHTEPDGATLDDLGPEAYVFDALRVDCTGHGGRQPIDVDDLPDGPAVEGPEPDCLAVWTGWDDHWATDRYRDHPYLAPAAAEWCASHGLSVALDTFGPDPTPSADPDRESAGEPDGLAAHHALHRAERRIVENLTGLGKVPDRFDLYAVPLSIPGSDGSPVRAFAEV